MSFSTSAGTLKSAYLSLNSGAPSATLFVVPALMRARIFTLGLSTSDSASPLLTLSGSTSGVLSRYYASSLAPLLDRCDSAPIVCQPGETITISASAITAAKTVEVRCVFTLKNT